MVSMGILGMGIMGVCYGNGHYGSVIWEWVVG